MVLRRDDLMPVTLSQVGVEKFIDLARKIAISVQNPRVGGPPTPGVTISFDVFIWIISKFVKTPIDLDATIEQTSPSRLPQLFVWGVRDPGIREGRGPKYFPGYQQGAWSYFLLDALRDGIPSEHIKMFRENLNLLAEYSVDDAKFFQIPPVPFK